MNLFDRPLTPGYRDELRDLEAEERTATQHRRGSILVFQLGTLRLALPTVVASAVAPVLHVARIPHRSGTVLLGVCAFRGEILPCCSLITLLGLPATTHSSEASGRTLILDESAGRRWAVPIDAVLGVQSIPETTAPLDLPIAPLWIKGSVPDPSGTFHLLDHDQLFRQLTLATA